MNVLSTFQSKDYEFLKVHIEDVSSGKSIENHAN